MSFVTPPALDALPTSTTPSCDRTIAPRISVVIPTLNRHDLLLATLRQLFDQRFEAFEVWIVDQSGPQLAKARARQLAAEFADPRLNYLNLETTGLPNARNEGIARSTADIILFIDDDVVLLSPDFLSAHVAQYCDPRVGAVCGRVIERFIVPNARRTGSRISWSGRTFENLLGKEACSLASVKGANMSFRAAVFDEVGGFDRRYTGTALLEEADMSTRISRHGWKLLFEPQAELLHLSASAGGVRTADALRTEWYRFRSTAYYVRKNRGALGLLPFGATFTAIAAVRALRWRSPSAITALLGAAVEGVRAARLTPDDAVPGRAAQGKIGARK